MYEYQEKWVLASDCVLVLTEWLDHWNCLFWKCLYLTQARNSISGSPNPPVRILLLTLAVTLAPFLSCPRYTLFPESGFFLVTLPSYINRYILFFRKRIPQLFILSWTCELRLTQYPESVIVGQSKLDLFMFHL